MDELLQGRLFNLLAEPSQEVTNEEMQDAYDDFFGKIEVVSCEKDYSKIYRTLVATRIELASLKTTSLYGQGEKCT
ncbi:hypothetical protein [Bacteroides thetaiotaomicron]|uniref:hypothetical protein n=1 Tax=Bacteroides thetaiotaomicron TaxID=818 RepID=UPI001F314F40|nr:hypothetical protein [Bacteroides thetaiotaomicron]MCE9138847.1 hypothetical protein [Bacteroides thetaiotaomicron]